MKKLYFMIFAALLSIMVACQKSADTGAVPVVRMVKPCDPQKGDMLLTEKEKIKGLYFKASGHRILFLIRRSHGIGIISWNAHDLFYKTT